MVPYGRGFLRAVIKSLILEKSGKNPPRNVPVRRIFSGVDPRLKVPIKTTEDINFNYIIRIKKPSNNQIIRSI